MIWRDHDLSVKRQTQLLGISHGSGYFLHRPASTAELALMRQIDELHMAPPLA